MGEKSSPEMKFYCKANLVYSSKGGGVSGCSDYCVTLYHYNFRHNISLYKNALINEVITKVVIIDTLVIASLQIDNKI